MASDYLILIQNVNGESQAQGMTNYIELDSFSWGASNAASIGNSGLSGGKASAHDFTCSFNLDKSSFQIVQNVFVGQHLDSVTFAGRKTGGGDNPFTYLQLTFTNCYLTSVSCGGGSSGIPPMSLSFAYEAMKWEYYTQDSATGAVTLAGSAGYNLAQAAKSS